MSNWLKDAVFYEIYPQSFFDTNADGIGDLKGIEEKLGYVKSLGCNAIWINPCFDSPFTDAGYDVRDYKLIAPRYGTNDDMRRLLKKAHEMGLHIILDLVPGHTSVEHKWFKESMKPEKNEYTDRYIWTNSIWESPESIACIRGISDRDGAAGVNFFSTQPALNYGYANPTRDYMMSPESEAPMKTREAIKDVMRFWLDMGADGFRVDMAGSLVKGDETGEANIKLWQDFRAFLDKEYPDAVMISEWGEPEKSIAGGFHMDFLLHFGPMCYTSLFRSENPFFSKAGKGDITLFKDEYEKFYRSSVGRGYICIPSSNHDMDRLARGRDVGELKVCFAFLLTMPGVPFIYYGDEIGMRYLEGLTSVEGGFGRTGSRSPMQWDKSENMGFSKATEDKLYIKTDDSADAPNVLEQEEDPNSLLNEIKLLTELRHSHKALMSDGKFEFVYAEKNKYPLVYKRFDENEQFIIVINPSGEEQSVDIGTKNAKLVHFTNKPAELKDSTVVIPPVSASILQTF